MRIIDSHVHFPLPPGGAETLVTEARRNGIGRVVFSHLADWSAYPSAAELRKGNAAAAEAVARFPETLSFLTYLNPQLPDWHDELENGIRSGAVGVKLWISLKDRNGSLANTVSVLKECAARDLPVLLHVFHRTHGNMPGEITLNELLALAEAVPECRMIGAHAGACLHDGRGLFRKLPSTVSIDLSGSFPLEGLLEELRKELPPERILFGSDALGRSFSSQLLKVFSAPLSAETRELILWKNAAGFFRLPAPDDPETDSAAPEFDRKTDFHCYCGRDPFGIAKEYTPQQLEHFFAGHGIGRAYCAGLEALLCHDPSEANARLIRSCAGLRIVRPLPTINPAAHNAAEVWNKAAAASPDGVWLSPYWSALRADAPEMLALGKLAERDKMVLFLHCGGPAEHRFRHPGVSPRPAEPEEIQRFLDALPETEIILLGCSGSLKLSPRHRQACDWPPDSGTEPETAGKVFGSGFPFRSFPFQRRLFNGFSASPPEHF